MIFKFYGSIMLYGMLLTVYILICLFLILIIMLQKGKGGMGLGGLDGGTQMLFGGSGGQDIFQKITWVLGVIFISGSLMLSLMKSRESETFKYAKKQSIAPKAAQQAPKIPVNNEK